MSNTQKKIIAIVFLSILLLCVVFALILGQLVGRMATMSEIVAEDNAAASAVAQIDSRATILEQSAAELIDLRYDGSSYNYNAGIFTLSEYYYTNGARKYVSNGVLIYYVESSNLSWGSGTGCQPLTVTMYQRNNTSNTDSIAFNVSRDTDLTDAGGMNLMAFGAGALSGVRLISGEEYIIKTEGTFWRSIYDRDWGASITVTYDSTAPTISASVASGGYTNQKVVVTAADSASGVRNLYVKTPNNNSFSAQSSRTYTIGNSGEGWYEFYAVDNLKNQSNTYKIYYDPTAPTISASVASGSYTNQKIVVTTTDSGSGISAYYVKTPKGTFTQVSGTTYTIGNNDNGWYEFYAFDNAGNRSSTYKVYYDSSSPEISASIASGGYTNQKISIAVSDGGSGISAYYAKVPGGAYEQVTGTTYVLGNAGEGWYEFYAVDKVGNRSDTYKIFYDYTVPTISASVTSGGYTNQKVVVTAADSASGIASYYVKTPGGSFGQVEGNAYTIGNSGEGWYELYAEDYAGNRSDTYKIYYETGVPTISASIASGGYTNQKIAVTAADSASGIASYYVKTPGGAFWQAEGTVYAIGNSGEGWYEFYAVDNAGNRSDTYKLYYDITIPVLNINSANGDIPDGGWANSDISFTISDIVSGINSSALYLWENGDWALILNNIHSDSIYSSNTVYFDTEDEEEYRVYYSDRTSAMNAIAAKLEAAVEVHKNYTPEASIGCTIPPSQINLALIGATYYLIENDGVKYIYFSRDDLAMYISGIASGRVGSAARELYAAEDGYYKVTATDNAGNSIEKTFSVDKTAPTLSFGEATTTDNQKIYARSGVSVSAVDDIVAIYYRNMSAMSDFAMLDGELSDMATYRIYAVDRAGNYSEVYELLISNISDFGNELPIRDGFKINSFYVVNLPARVFGVRGKDNISGKYSFASYDSALSWAITKEYEYRVTALSTGWLYVAASNENISQIYTDEDILMSAVRSYASKYVASEPTIVNAAGTTDFYTIMDENGNPDPSALTDQKISVPVWLDDKYSALPIYLIRSGFVFTAPKLSYGNFAGKIRFDFLGDATAAVSPAQYSVEYGAVLNAEIDGAQQGYYLVTEYDLCGNTQQYIVYVDFQAPTINAEVLLGDGSTSQIAITNDWLEENAATMYYISIDLQSCIDNIDEYYVLTASNGGTVITCLQGEALPVISADTYASGRWTVSIYDRAGNIMEFTVYIADAAPYWTYSSLDSIRQVNFYFRTSESYNALTSIKIYRVSADGSETEITEDSNGTPVTASTTNYTFTVGGKYIARVTDMFGRVVELGPVFYTKGLPTGRLSGVSAGKTTNTDVTFVFSGDYDLTTYIWQGEEWIVWNESNYQLSYSAATGNYTALYLATAENCYEYKLFLADKHDDNLFIEYTFAIDCIMAEYKVVLSDGTELALSEEMSTNQPFYIMWSEDGVRSKYATTTIFTTSFNKGDMFSSDGRYTFYLTDYAGNEAVFSVLLDTKVSFTIKSSVGNYQLIDGIYYSAHPITVTVDELYSSFEYVTSNGFVVENGTPIKEDGRYDIDIIDYYGNSAHITVIIDTAPPEYTLSGGINGGTGNNSVTITFGEDVVRAVRMSASGSIIGEIASGQTFSDEGAYYIRLSDLTGNTSSVSFNIDRSVKYTSSVINGQVTSSAVEIKIDEAGGIVTVNGEQQTASSIKLSAAGDYSVTLTDVTGNAVSLVFIIIEREYQIFDYEFEIGTSLVSATKDGQSVQAAIEGGKLSLTESGSYELALCAPGGQAYVLAVVVDNIPPEAELTLGENGSVTLSSISKDNVTIVATKDGAPLSCKVGQTFTENGEYVITVTDSLGNVSTITFEIPYRLSTISIVIIAVGAVAVVGVIVLIVAKRKIKS